MISLRSTDPATLEERAAMDLKYDGPWHQKDLEDHRAQVRGAYAPESAVELMAKIRWAQNDRKFYQAEIDRLDQERAQLLADREGLYAGEYDRMTRHADHLESQKASPREMVASYTALITECQAKMDAMTAQPLAAE